MGLRRERPSQEIGTGSLNIRLGDGTSVRFSTREARGPVTPAVCCFCGEAIEESDPHHVTVSVRRTDESPELQSWSAHDSCLADRLHDSVKGDGTF